MVPLAMFTHGFMFQRSLIVLIVLSSGSWPALMPAQSVTLRNLQRLSPMTVTRWDDFSVQLENGQRLSWDAILDAEVATRPEEFAARLRRFGEPLAKFKWRLRTGDHRSADALVNELLPETQLRTLPSGLGEDDRASWQQEANLKYLLNLVRFQASLDQGQPTSGLVPMLLALQLDPWVDAETKAMAAGLELTTTEKQSGYSRRIPPVWFDPDRQRMDYEYLQQRCSEPDCPESLQLYLAAIEIDLAMDSQAAERLEPLLRPESGKPPPAYHRDAQALKRYLELKRLPVESRSDPISLPTVLADYLNARLKFPGDSGNQRVLRWLRVPAHWSREYPELAAAALDQAARLSQQQDQLKNAARLEEELLSTFPNSYHARQRRKQR